MAIGVGVARGCGMADGGVGVSRQVCAEDADEDGNGGLTWVAPGLMFES